MNRNTQHNLEWHRKCMLLNWRKILFTHKLSLITIFMNITCLSWPFLRSLNTPRVSSLWPVEGVLKCLTDSWQYICSIFWIWYVINSETFSMSFFAIYFTFLWNYPFDSLIIRWGVRPKQTHEALSLISVHTDSWRKPCSWELPTFTFPISTQEIDIWCFFCKKHFSASQWSFGCAFYTIMEKGQRLIYLLSMHFSYIALPLNKISLNYQRISCQIFFIHHVYKKTLYSSSHTVQTSTIQVSKLRKS